MSAWMDSLDWTNKRVLDVGGYDGRAAADALSRGALSAILVDNGEFRQYDWPEPGLRDQRIVRVEQDVMDYNKPADIVICLMVIYHLKDPRAGLAHLRKLSKEALCITSDYVAENEADENGWRWYADGSGHPNGTVWCRPTHEGLLKAIKAAGFTTIHHRGEEQRVYVCE